MKRRKITALSYIGSGRFRATFSCSHVQEIQGSTTRLPRMANCAACN